MIDITILKVNEDDYISLTDMAKSQMQDHIIFKWLSLKNTIDYIGEWEMLYNPNFNCTEFGIIRNSAGTKPWFGWKHTRLCPNQIAIQQMQILEGTSTKLIE